MPYTNEKTLNTIEDKNTMKSRTYFLCGPQQKTSGHDKTLTENVIINENILFVFSTYRNETCIKPSDPYRKISVRNTNTHEML